MEKETFRKRLKQIEKEMARLKAEQNIIEYALQVCSQVGKYND